MKIMFFAHDPGGGNSIQPLIEPLKNVGHEVFVFAKGPSLNILDNSSEYIEGMMEKIKPDLIITGTSGDDFTERNLWTKSKNLGIKSIAILDHWINYGMRFSKYNSYNFKLYNKKCDFLPTYIIVMDEYAKEEMIKDGVPSDIIFPLGNQHFENIVNKYDVTENIKYKLVDNNDFLITFASQPYSEFYKNNVEIIVLEDLMKVVENLQNVKILARSHPRENKNKYLKYKSEKVIIENQYKPIEIIKASDLIVSITSMFLIESMLVGKKCISYQPHETNKNNFVMTKNNELKFINNYKDFKEEVIYQYNMKDSGKNKKLSIENSLEKTISFIEGLSKNEK